MSKTKKFTISSDDTLNAYISVTMKVNTPRQAKTRFLKKHEPVLFGYWLFSITNADGVEVGHFEVNKTFNDKTSSRTGNKTVNREQQYMIDSDGMIHKWSGRGRIPRGFDYYEMPNINAMPLRDVQKLQQRIVNTDSGNKTVNNGKHYKRKRRAK